MKAIFLDVGESGMNLYKAFEYVVKGKFNLADISVQIDKAGIGSIFIVMITSIFIGLAMSAQLSRELTDNFGAGHIVGGLIGMATVRELAPIFTAIVVIGRVGASISAEIGSMKASEQVDALIVLGVDPIKFLIVPRLLAAAIISPLLTVISSVCSILSGMFIAHSVANLNYSIYIDSLHNFVEINDVFIMLIKSIVFGVLIAIIATTRGLQVKGGAEAVGESATRTVVSSIILIFISNYIITSIFYGS